MNTNNVDVTVGFHGSKMEIPDKTQVLINSNKENPDKWNLLEKMHQNAPVTTIQISEGRLAMNEKKSIVVIRILAQIGASGRKTKTSAMGVFSFLCNPEIAKHHLESFKRITKCSAVKISVRRNSNILVFYATLAEQLLD